MSELKFGGCPSCGKSDCIARACARAAVQAAQPEAVGLIRAMLHNAMDRMDRARNLLTDGHPRPDCNWGMLDASDLRKALAAAPTEAKPAQDAVDAWRDVLAERERQKSAEGYTPEHDNSHRHGDMSTAAACYAMMGRYHYPAAGHPPPQWPWDPDSWKPTTYRRNLVKAGALILAEIERLDRAAISAKKGGA